jgi:hypothetical protein
MLPGGIHYQVKNPLATLDELVAADSITLMLSNQKNGVQDATLNHEAVPALFCPIKSLTRWYFASWWTQPQNEYALLCKYVPPQDRHGQKHWSSSPMSGILNHNLDGRVCPRPDRYSSHPGIRGHATISEWNTRGKNYENRKLESKMWLTYVHNQIAAVSQLMARPLIFYNVAVQ